MEKRFQPKYNPLQVFEGSKSPAGLYARQKWRHEESTEGWASDFNETVNSLRAGQLADGSWKNCEIDTIHRLFGLHLTVRESDDAIERALGWLLSLDETLHGNMANEIDETLFHSLPFSNGCREHFVDCAGLFLANCFGQGETREVTRLYDTIAERSKQKMAVCATLGVQTMLCGPLLSISNTQRAGLPC